MVFVYDKPTIVINDLNGPFYVNNSYELKTIITSKLPNLQYEWSVSPTLSINTSNTTGCMSFLATKKGDYTFNVTLKDENGKVINQAKRLFLLLNNQQLIIM